MSDINNDIRAALESHLNAANLADIAWENVSYSPTTGTKFIKTVYTPTTRRPSVMGLSPQQRYDGLFRVLCHAAEGSGPKEANDLATSVIQLFEATSDIDYTGSQTVRVSIDFAERRIAFVDNPWYIVPVNISWYTYK